MSEDLTRYLNPSHRQGMTVAQLREELEQFDDDKVVLFSYNYGDYWRTQVAERAQQVTTQRVKWNARLDMPEVEEDDGEDGEVDYDWVEVVVIGNGRY